MTSARIPGIPTHRTRAVACPETSRQDHVLFGPCDRDYIGMSTMSSNVPNFENHLCRAIICSESLQTIQKIGSTARAYKTNEGCVMETICSTAPLLSAFPARQLRRTAGRAPLQTVATGPAPVPRLATCGRSVRGDAREVAYLSTLQFVLGRLEGIWIDLGSSNLYVISFRFKRNVVQDPSASFRKTQF